MWNSLPEFGGVMIGAILVAAAYTFAVSLAAGGGRPRLLRAARLGTYGTLALVGVAVLVLAYAFVSHDFRIRYVAHYSDRSMSTALLIAALWGGQDGSLLWWLFLSTAFSGACVWWMKGRYRELQPVVVAVLMAVVMFLAIVMLFAANPFATSAAAAPPDGVGLNYQLRNFYMIVHPPALYLGFTSAAVPFAFAVAALVRDRLDSEWIVAARKWMLVSWLFMTIGNGLGMIWAYEELGWGGYWAWDPVENASLLPWLTATAYLHSTAVQERRGMLKRTNVFLVSATFLLTLFSTFLTRSGLIASVHAFAQSGIGTFFLYFMVLLIAASLALGVGRRAQLKSEAALDSALSREGSVLASAVLLVLLTALVMVATLWPRLSEWLLDQPATVGPSFYNAFVPPLGMVVLALMGIGPLLGWRRSSRRALRRGLRVPLVAMAAMAVVHAVLGPRLGMPAWVELEAPYGGGLGAALSWLGGKLPVVTSALAAFNGAVIVQETVRAARARRASRPEQGALSALFRVVSKSRRRHGGYLVHLGVAIMFVGFAGQAWGTKAEASLAPGEQVNAAGYTLRYLGMRDRHDREKQMFFADLEVSRDGRSVARLSPAKYVYRANPRQPSTEVARYVTLGHDLYVIVGMLDRRSRMASFEIHLNPLVSLVWWGLVLMTLGGLLAWWPEARGRRKRGFGYLPASSATAAVVAGAALALGMGSRRR